MIAGAALRRTFTGYEFSSEHALEEFLWNNLEQLFQLKPIVLQQKALGEFYDILAANNKQLSILELKNNRERARHSPRSYNFNAHVPYTLNFYTNIISNNLIYIGIS